MIALLHNAEIRVSVMVEPGLQEIRELMFTGKLHIAGHNRAANATGSGLVRCRSPVR
jgi:hypothetical protein